jgi:putative inorganic carbon (HCO3(-)) transporter
MGQTVQSDSFYVGGDVTETLESSSATRIKIWRGAIDMIKDYPMWGVGYGAFPAFVPKYTSGAVGQMDAHNSYLLIAAEMGIPTLLVFLVVLAMIMYYTRWLYHHAQDRALKAMALGFLAGLSALSVANMFGSRMDAQEIAGYFWILAGLVMRGIIIEKSSRVGGFAGSRVNR